MAVTSNIDAVVVTRLWWDMVADAHAAIGWQAAAPQSLVRGSEADPDGCNLWARVLFPTVVRRRRAANDRGSDVADVECILEIVSTPVAQNAAQEAVVAAASNFAAALEQAARVDGTTNHKLELSGADAVSFEVAPLEDGPHALARVSVRGIAFRDQGTALVAPPSPV